MYLGFSVLYDGSGLTVNKAKKEYGPFSGVQISTIDHELQTGPLQLSPVGLNLGLFACDTSGVPPLSYNFYSASRKQTQKPNPSKEEIRVKTAGHRASTSVVPSHIILP